jgi:IrrE N-terminal-like domain
MPGAHIPQPLVDLGDSQEDGDPPNYNWRHERAANEFAAALLMPPTLVHDASRHPLRSEGSLPSLSQRTGDELPAHNLGLR